MKGLSAKDQRELKRWAKRAVHGLDESACFVGIMDDGPLDTARIEFTMQLGHAILHDKPIVLPVPHGVEIPTKLAAVADRIVRYDAKNPESLTHALTAALVEMGINKQ